MTEGEPTGDGRARRPRRASRPAGPPGGQGQGDGDPPAPGAAARGVRGAAPDQTRDDTDHGWGEVPETEDGHEGWLRRQRPPHWE